MTDAARHRMPEISHAAANREPRTVGDIDTTRRAALASLTTTRKPEERAASEQQRIDRERRDHWELLAGKLGRRYRDCRFDNFHTHTDAQRKAVGIVQEYAGRISESVSAGEGIILFGPCGTGKDHLLTAVLHVACLAGVQPVEWINCEEFFAERRDGIDAEEKETKTLARLMRPALLAISDPAPGGVTKLTDWQRTWLYRILDKRYRNKKATCLTINVANRDELYALLGTSTAERAIDGAETVLCSWPSYRHRRGAESISMRQPG